MNAVLHLFDFQHFQLCLHPQDSSFLSDDPTPLKGLEAPRNSLESITEEEKDDHHYQTKKGIIQLKTNRRDTGLKLVQVPRGNKMEDFSSESSSCSPASARTPTLVARLMGLDILPESTTTTPRSSHSQTPPYIRPSSSTPPPPTSTSTTTTTTRTRKSCTTTTITHGVSGLRSLPETPRLSPSTRRRSTSTDVVEHHRLSLQINKENSIVKEMELSRPSCSAITTKRREGRNNENNEEVAKSPSYYARQIMKQVRETVSRRVGHDITNTVSSSDGRRRDEHLLSSTTQQKMSISKSKRSKKEQFHLSSSSPKTYNDENKFTTAVTEFPPPPRTVVTVQETTTVRGGGGDQKSDTGNNNNSSSSKMSSKKLPPLKSYNSIRNKKEEQFVHPLTTAAAMAATSKKCKKTMLSSDLLHGTVPSVVPLKKDSYSPTKLLDNQGLSSNAQPSKPIISNNNNNNITTTNTTTTRLSRYPRQRIDEKRQEEATHAPPTVHHHRWRSRKDVRSGTGTGNGTGTGTSVMEFQYISRILKCTGIDRDTPVSFMRWFLPSHPLDPSIYHTLEATHYITTSDKFSFEQQSHLSINRKLIFHLVDEMLANMLKPYVKLKLHYYKQDQQMNGFQLVKTLCTKIRGFPSADCQTLQDIDALVEKDLPRIGGVSSNLVANYQDEGEDVVLEIERHIMESLIKEICSI
ncbi:hypothetical protein SOVF_133600 [Spinacia oleracea]|nr:hypothetical protein SOVF_133600 [Spinacia oleracea]